MHKLLDIDVYNAGYSRLRTLYEQGHRVVCSFSAGKDSGVCLELAIMAARDAGKLPVEVVMRDEEIMLPGTFEYAERIAKRPDVKFYWYYAGQPIVNIFNRTNPYYWVFDDRISPDDWVRKPPSFAVKINDLNIERLVTPERFPPDAGKDLIIIIGLRVQESMNRMILKHLSS